MFTETVEEYRAQEFRRFCNAFGIEYGSKKWVRLLNLVRASGKLEEAIIALETK